MNLHSYYDHKPCGVEWIGDVPEHWNRPLLKGVALPLNMFYNTGIATYIWVLSNRKAAHRRGRVQLIDATKWSRPLRKNLSSRNCELSDEEGGIETFLRREVLPYAPDAWYVPDSAKVGYEISFTRHCYKPQPLRPLEEIRADILALERETKGLLAEVIGSRPE